MTVAMLLGVLGCVAGCGGSSSETAQARTARQHQEWESKCAAEHPGETNDGELVGVAAQECIQRNEKKERVLKECDAEHGVAESESKHELDDAEAEAFQSCVRKATLAEEEMEHKS